MERIKTVAIGVVAAALAAWMTPPVAAQAPRLADDERVILFPSAASLSEDGSAWEIPVHAWVFEPEVDDLVRRRMIDSVRAALDLPVTGERTAVLQRRLPWFLVDNERGKRVEVGVEMVDRLGEERSLPYTLMLPETNSNGHARAVARIPVSMVEGEAPATMLLRVTNPGGEQVGIPAFAPLIGPTGLSVISDIDDTIKVSQVTDKTQLLRRTFVMEFEPAPGMAEFYRKLEAEHGAVFHLVSSSPWQLQPELAAMVREHGFPEADFHLKEFRLKDSSVLDLFADPMETKPPLIEAIMDRWPQRRFILIGDSGEADPEVYGRIAAARPGQVAAIYIRDVTGQGRDDPRYAEAFAGIAEEKWHLFTDPAELEGVDRLPGDVEE